MAGDTSHVVTAAVERAEREGVADLAGARSVAHRLVKGEWPGTHPAEGSERGRDRLMDLYKPVVAKAITEDGEASTTLAKSGRLETVSFKARMPGAVKPIFKDDGRFIIWGPASVEVVDKEGDRIAAKALEKALPQLLKRARLSVEHSDQLVGDILDGFESDEPVEVEIDGNTYKRDSFPTAVMELDGMPPALYVCGEIWEDTNQAREARKAAIAGELNSYSISGEALVTKTSVEDGSLVDDIVEMDLSAVTLCKEGMNQHAAFAVVAKEDADDAGEARTLTKSDLESALKSALDTNTMTDPEISKEDLIKTFEEVLTDYGVVSKDEMTAYVDQAVSSAPVAPDAAPEAETVPEAGEEVAAEVESQEPSTDVTAPSPVDKNAQEVAALMADKYGIDAEEVLSLLEEVMDSEAEADAAESEEVDVEGDSPVEEEPDVDASADVEDPSADGVEADLAADADVGAFGEESGGHSYGPDDLQEMLPDDVWEVVSQYLASDGEEADPMDVEADPADPMAAEKADEESMDEYDDADDEDEVGGEGEFGKDADDATADISEVVKAELNKFVSPGAERPVSKADADPSHEGKEVKKASKPSDIVLGSVYENLR